MNWMDRLTGGRHLRDTGIDWRDLWLPKPLAKLASPTRKIYKVINKQTNKQIHNSVTLQQPMVPLEIEIQSKLNIQGININAYILKFQKLHAPKFSRSLLYVLLYKICNILNPCKFWCKEPQCTQLSKIYVYVQVWTYRYKKKENNRQR